MAVISELLSLNEIDYKAPVKKLFLFALAFFMFVFSFLNFYPIGDALKGIIKKTLPANCALDYGAIKLEFFLPKIVITDLVVPSGCFNMPPSSIGLPSSYSFPQISLNWHIISFMPFGTPFKLDTEFSGQPISIYYVLGLTEHTIRLKDQDLNINKFKNFISGKEVKGNIIVDLTATIKSNKLSSLNIKAQSKNFEIPQMTIMEMFTIPSLKLRHLFLEVNSSSGKIININKMVIGDPEAEIRASFKGKIEMQEGNSSFSPLDLTGELAFSEDFLKKIPANEFLGAYTQKDGFYQMRIGGTLGQPIPSPL